MRHLIPLTLTGAALVSALAACSEPTQPSARAPRAADPHGPRSAMASAQFVITRQDLGTLGGSQSRAVGNNDNGLVVGWSLTSAGQKRAFKWTAGGGMRALSTLAPGRPCQANHVTENGQIAGSCVNASGKQHAVLWSAAGVIRDLGTLPGGTTSQGTDVNDAGVVVGFSDVVIGGSHTTHGFRWTAGRGMQDLGADDFGEPGLFQYCPTYAERINRSGQIVGTEAACETNEFAVLWSAAGAIQGLGAPGVVDYSYGQGINDLGHVVGHGDEAALWTPGSVRNLGSLPGAYGSSALAVNNSDQVVGYSGTATRQIHAFIWTLARGMQDLGTLPGGTQSSANDINNHTPRQVVGWSNKTGGAIHATLWTLQ